MTDISPVFPIIFTWVKKCEILDSSCHSFDIEQHIWDIKELSGAWIIVLRPSKMWSIDRRNTESGGQLTPPPLLFQMVVKEYCLTPIFNVCKTCFWPSLGHCHAQSTPFTLVHYAHIKLSLVYPTLSVTISLPVPSNY